MELNSIAPRASFIALESDVLGGAAFFTTAEVVTVAAAVVECADVALDVVEVEFHELAGVVVADTDGVMAACAVVLTTAVLLDTIMYTG